MQFEEDFFKRHDYYSIIASLLKKGEKVQIKLYGHCMSPFVRNGEIVTISPVSHLKLCCGDIIVYKYKDRFKIHRFLRLVQIENESFLISKGDRAMNIDPPVSLEAFLGKLLLLHRGSRILNLENPYCRVVSFIIGKISPCKFRIYCFFYFPKRIASKLFKTIFGVNFRTYIQRFNKKA